MATLTENLQSLVTAKENLRSAINAKGGELETTAKLSQFATAVEGLSTQMDIYKCATVDTVNKTWTGYKAVCTNGEYSFMETTTNLSYTQASPSVGFIYDEDVSMKISIIKTPNTVLNNSNTKILVYPAASNGELIDLAAGVNTPHTFTTHGTSLVYDSERLGWLMTGQSGIVVQPPALNGMSNTQEWTLDFCCSRNGGDEYHYFGGCGGDYGPRCDIFAQGRMFEFNNGNLVNFPADNTMHQLTFEYYLENGTWQRAVYLDGVKKETGTGQYGLPAENYSYGLGADNMDYVYRGWVGTYRAFRYQAEALHRGQNFTPEFLLTDELPITEGELE